MVTLLWLWFACWAVVPLTLAQQPEATTAYQLAVHTSFDSITLPDDERMGLLGVGYRTAGGQGLYGGIEIFSAVSGERGGFFTGGAVAGWRRPIAEHWLGDIGLFAGAGGGGSAPQGGGLMLRPHGGLWYVSDLGHLGAGISRVYFPNGEINSTQMFLSWQTPLQVWIRPGWRSSGTSGAKGGRSSGPGSYELQTVIRSYRPASGTRATDGRLHDQRFDLLGIGLRQVSWGNAYWMAEALGAVQGAADGFAQLDAGIGYLHPMSGRHTLEAAIRVGAAGGGRVDTGGGLLVLPEIGWRYDLSSRWLLGVNLGYAKTPDGAFRAVSVGAYAGYHEKPGGMLDAQPGDREVASRPLRLRLVHQHYIPEANLRQGAGGQTEAVELLGVKLDAMLSSAGYVSGQALGAYDGSAGGYAIGLLGGGWRAPSGVFAEALIGAAGGGGLNVGGGLVAQALAGVEWEMGTNSAISLGVGRLLALDGPMQLNLVELGLVYRFTGSNRSMPGH